MPAEAELIKSKQTKKKIRKPEVYCNCKCVIKYKKRKEKEQKKNLTYQAPIYKISSCKRTYDDENMHLLFFGLVLVLFRPGRTDTQPAVT